MLFNGSRDVTHMYIVHICMSWRVVEVCICQGWLQRSLYGTDVCKGLCMALMAVEINSCH